MFTLWGYNPNQSIQPVELWVGSQRECQIEADHLFRKHPQYTHLGVYPSRIGGQDLIPQYFLRNCDLRARRAW